MGNNYQADQNKANSFYLQNEAAIKGMFSGELFSMEVDNGKLAKMLDQACGIDYILLSRAASAYGVASRINFNKYHFGHVTIRYKRSSGAKTEYQKRVDAIRRRNGELYATITMQIDAEKNRLKKAIIFQSDHLYSFIDQNIKDFEAKFVQINHDDGNLFFRIPYKAITEMSESAGFKAKIVDFA